jgi:tetratricopeptide (TPR) repeat protein
VRRLVLLALLLVTALAAAITWQTASRRERDYRALMSQGDEALAAEQTFGAIEAYSGAIALRPDTMLPHLRRGETYLRRGDLGASARDFQIAAALDSSATRPLEELGDVRYKLALSRYRSGNFGGALTALEATLRNDEHMSTAHYLRGLCLRETNRLDAAQRAMETAVSLAPGFIAAREELADVHRLLGHHRDELEQLQVLAALDRDRIERHIAVGLAHARWSADPQETAARRAGQADLAVLTLGIALERAPDQSQIYSALGGVWLDISEARGDRVAFSKALQALERVGASTAATSESLTLYGRALLQADRTEEAERTLQRATERYPIDPSAFLLYASAAERQNHADAARDALIRYGAVVSNDSGFADRASRIAGLSLKLNDRAAAVAWVQRGLERDPGHAGLLALQHHL